MSVFAAILLDAYRELNSRKLFWLVLALSVLFIIVYGSIGFDEAGMSLFFGLFHIESDVLTHDSPMSKVLYRGIFSTFVVPLWLAWAATILALISTCTIFPDFVAGGSIDLVLSKPVRRTTLFFMKYAASLLFVLLQVAVFCVGIFLCMGLRLGDWEWKVLLAIPVVTVFYSYLYSVCVLVGVRTGSALAALLLTMLFWVSLFSLNGAETIMNSFLTTSEVQIIRSREEIATAQQQITTLTPNARQAGRERIELNDAINDANLRIEALQHTRDLLEPWHRSMRVTQRFLPKTSETIGLLERWLARHDDINLMDLMSGNVQQDPAGRFGLRDNTLEREAQARMIAEVESRSLWYVIGTSLLFEGVVLAIACWIFIRRDF